jgi:hypothetical protein
VYYAATADVQKDEILKLRHYLGVSIRSKTRRQLGMEFHRWIRLANRAYNKFLDTARLGHFDRIEGDIGAYYLRRAREHTASFQPESRRISKMTIGHGIAVWPSVPLHEMEPDGLFAEGKRAVVFESKLSKPKYGEFGSDVAAYAMAVEYGLKKDVDHAIILHSCYPRGRIRTEIHDILDSDIAQVTSNVDRFLRLVQYSYLARQEETIQKTGQRQSFQSWKAFLVRPLGMPTKSIHDPCRWCKYTPLCLTPEAENNDT